MTLTPVYETGRPLRLAGLRKFYLFSERAKIPLQWEAFGPRMGQIEARIGKTAYGAVLNPRRKDGFDYMTAVEVDADASIPTAFDSVTVDAARYAVFHHGGNLATIMETMSAIHRDFMPKVKGRCLEDVLMLERYGENFDPKTGDGGIDFMAPLAR